jgi:hypothetical protein
MPPLPRPSPASARKAVKVGKSLATLGAKARSDLLCDLRAGRSCRCQGADGLDSVRARGQVILLVLEVLRRQRGQAGALAVVFVAHPRPQVQQAFSLARED